MTDQYSAGHDRNRRQVGAQQPARVMRRYRFGVCLLKTSPTLARLSF
jgi:hypothetical protein